MIVDDLTVKAICRLFEVIFLFYSVTIKLPINSNTTPVSRRTAS